MRALDLGTHRRQAGSAVAEPWTVMGDGKRKRPRFRKSGFLRLKGGRVVVARNGCSSTPVMADGFGQLCDP